MAPDQIDRILLPFRRSLLEHLLQIALIAGIPALATGIYASLRASIFYILALDLIAYAVLVVAYLVVKTHYRLGARLFVYIALLLGIVFLFTIGTGGATSLWLAAATVLATLLLERNQTYVVSAISCFAIAVASVFLARGELPWSMPFYGWLSVVGSLVVLVSVLSISIAYLFRRLAQSLLREQILNREVHHRVRNNLQLIESLLSIEAGAAQHQETLRTINLMIDRVSAIAHSFAHLRTDTEVLVVEVQDLFESLTIDQQQHGRPPVQLSVGVAPPTVALDTAIPLAVVAAEILAHHNTLGSEIEIHLSSHDRLFTTTVVDRRENGADRPPVPEIQMEIMQALISQINGAFTLHPAEEDRSTIAKIDCPLSLTSAVE